MTIKEVEYDTTALSKRKLTLRTAKATTDILISVRVPGDTSGPRGVFLNHDDAIDLATRILADLQPELLKRVPLSMLPPGTFLQHRDTGTILKVVEFDVEKFEEWADNGPSLNEAFAVDAEGYAQIPFQEPGKDPWEVIEVVEVPKVEWIKVKKA